MNLGYTNCTCLCMPNLLLFKDLMGTMLGIQSSLNGAAGALAPPLGGFLYRGLLMMVPFLCPIGFALSLAEA